MAAAYVLGIGLTLLAGAFIVWRVWLRRRLQPLAECAAVLGRSVVDRDAHPIPAAVARMKSRTSSKRRLSLTDRERYIELWKVNQARFAIDLRGAVLEAETILADMMRRRGYALSHSPCLAEEATPAQQRIVANYLVATEIVGRYRRGEVAVDELGKAMVCYRALFTQLLESSVSPAEHGVSLRSVQP